MDYRLLMIRGKYLPLWRLQWSWLLHLVVSTTTVMLRMKTTVWLVMMGLQVELWSLIVIVSVWLVIVVIMVGGFWNVKR